MKSARALVDRKAYGEAEALLRTLLGQDPRSVEAMYLLALVQQRQNHPADSLHTYTAAAAIRTPNAEELRLVALDYVLLNDFPDADHWLQRSLALSPQSPEGLYDLARVRMHDGRFGEAATLLNRSLALRPGSSKAWDNLGVCLEAQNKSDEAEGAYQKAVEAADRPGESNAQAFVDYGTLLNTRNSFARAVPLLQRAVALAPTDAKGYAELGRGYLGLGETAEALRSMERAVSLEPSNSRFHYQLGRMYKASGDAEKARKEFAASAALYGGKSAE